MGYLNNQIVTVDAILTKKGRELLAKNDGSFQITQFAVADDEIDYTLYNPNHPSGSSFYGEAIENMPLLEAFPDDTQIMKYKLATLPRGTAKLPVLDLGFAAITLKQGASLAITPQTLNYLGAAQANETSGYSCTIADVRVLNSFTGIGIDTAAAQAQNTTVNQTLGTNISQTVIGSQINVRATTVNTLFGSTAKTGAQIRTTLTFVGLDSGARLTIPLTITKTNV
jgi:hypothetical protein|tara:strand:+ start:14647 stop:15324 length:678 start_codon:yes stop_codon:yes gene_type:complete